MPELKRWLACRGASRSGKRATLIEHVNVYNSTSFEVVLLRELVDPDSGIHLELKKKHLAVVRSTSSCRQPPKAPLSDWSLGLANIPKQRYSQMYDYLVASKAISADGAEMGALKSLKAVNFF